jgi:hypothetical protein
MNPRINHIFQEEMKEDTSFKEKKTGLDILFGRTKYHQHEMLETWNKGIVLWKEKFRNDPEVLTELNNRLQA